MSTNLAKRRKRQMGKRAILTQLYQGLAGSCVPLKGGRGKTREKAWP